MEQKLHLPIFIESEGGPTPSLLTAERVTLKSVDERHWKGTLTNSLQLMSTHGIGAKDEFNVIIEFDVIFTIYALTDPRIPSATV